MDEDKAGPTVHFRRDLLDNHQAIIEYPDGFAIQIVQVDEGAYFSAHSRGNHFGFPEPLLYMERWRRESQDTRPLGECFKDMVHAFVADGGGSHE